MNATTGRGLQSCVGAEAPEPEVNAKAGSVQRQRQST